MFSIALISFVATAYLAVLFLIAWHADKSNTSRARASVYALSLGVYCTSWAFFGTTAQAANNGWWLAPTYLGTILLFIFGWQIYLRIATICRTQKLTSMADFIATRYGQSSSLSGLVSLISVIAVVPYIALQLNATSTSIALLTNSPKTPALFWQDSTFYITLLLAIFAVLFGTRRVRPSEHNPGLMTAIAFESLVKLFAFLAVGLYVCFGLFDSPWQLFDQAKQDGVLEQIEQTRSSNYVYWVHVLLGVLATLCLPRQFHTAFIEQGSDKQLVTARWLFPLYLLLITLFTLPIAYAGLILFNGQSVGYDTFVLALPIAAEQSFVTMIAFLGGFSAATSMVIVSSIVLSIMITNDFINQFLLRRTAMHSMQRGLTKARLLYARRAVIVGILLLSYVSHRVFADGNTLANMGLMSFALVAQFAPAMVIGLWWRKASCLGAKLGILSGSLVWFYTLLLPSLVVGLLGQQIWLTQGPFGVSWLAPKDLFTLGFDPVSQAVCLSLAVNTLVYFLVPWFSQAKLAERLQSNRFILSEADHKLAQTPLTYQDFADLLQRFGEPNSTQVLLEQYFPKERLKWRTVAPSSIEALVEREMSALIGGPSARLILQASKDEKAQSIEQVAEFVDEASQVLRFNRDLLQATIENVEQGISVVDSELRLVAWNQRYSDMFAYPDGSLFIGRPVAELIQLNAERQLFDFNDLHKEVEKRLTYLKQGSAYKYRRQHHDGRVFEMQGNPLPGGGFVTTYTDISDFIRQQHALEQANTSLEAKIQARTAELVAANQQLELAKREAERATESKTRFFAAASHDLLQPFNAASLFCALMNERAQGSELAALSDNIKDALASAEDLLSSILELTKLEAGAFKTNVTTFNIQTLIDPLSNEYRAIAHAKSLSFVVETCAVAVTTDKGLLKRVLSNLLSNAIRYTEQGEVRLKLERHGEQLSILVEDTGVGIAKDDQSLIFQEFKQLGERNHGQGLGLGLAISKRICDLLNVNIVMGSVLGKGTQFTLLLSCRNALAQSMQSVSLEVNKDSQLHGVRIWLLDNDKHALDALQQLLSNWGCEVRVATNQAQLAELNHTSEADLLIADYQLDAGITGLDVIYELALETMPIIINTANHDETIREKVTDSGFPLLYKPLKAPALKRMLKRSLSL
ncbi:Sensory box histidine kinase/response regulator [Pseudoalteromonas luteoviolacea B = ATCC 29581]|nr:Sensory box histidine kinase/response regulator [Pseudoalteromonas luteoviolacea B = ATCC 29581]